MTTPASISSNVRDALSMRTLGEAFLATVEARGGQPALATEDGTLTLTWREYGEQARRAGAGLVGLGVQRGDTVGLLLSNRPEFHVTDAGALLVGATTFSMYNTYPPEQLAYLLTDTGARVVVTEPALLPGLLAARELEGPVLETIVVVGEPVEATIAWSALIDADPDAVDLDARTAAVESDDIAVISYTSGTTGAPKGVQLTHRNMLAVADSILQVMAVDPDYHLLSYLPMAHVAERFCSHYMPMFVGYSIISIPVLDRLGAALPKFRPNILFSPPRLWEKLRVAVQTKIAANDNAEVRAQLARALEVGVEALRERQAGRELSASLATELQQSEPLRSAIRAGLGLDAIAVAVTGAAPVPPQVIEFFHGLGIPLQEIYGLSETTGLITMTRADELKPGSVGRALPGMEIRLADDGEILSRGPLIMAGYRNRPEATAEMIDSEGWLRTGDIGQLDHDGYLHVVDRKKELIINAAGKNMSPANIEARIKESSPLIGQACAIGDGRPYNVALVVLDPEAVVVFARANSLPDAKFEQLATEPVVRAAIQSAIDEANAGLARVEQIKRFTILPVEWRTDSDELTPTSKLKRRPIARKYAAEIEALYAG
ncbi:long-chain fatty acid--CoA ligase [Nocardia sp. CA2R105]|uniref:AMP-dependent synthetase/ligase n=1 Tax=Nocardia coffeae TaxID=2873381 RepID=UPI001CA6C3A9|nr:long-chain fatty acid--CoA ligase [Nocardia coffeae]MBY8863410.1 long-chain fatty acid--CoA ligase [Nocardia coffeae]